MLIDTHCHINIMVKEKFDTLLELENFKAVQIILDQANDVDVKKIINVGTSLIESINSIELARKYKNIFAAIGVHPNDLTENWKQDLKKLIEYLKNKHVNKIVAIGECGIDLFHSKDSLQLQQDAFRTQIELALNHDLAVIVHSRDAGEETLRIIEEFKCPELRGTIHCFSYDLAFAREAINLNFVLGIGGTITYPKNEVLRETVKSVKLDNIILETDAPFLPPQFMRGKQNHPKYIRYIAEYIADLIQEPYELVASKTTENCDKIFKLEKS